MGAPLWDVATPARPHRVAGVAMAGFSDLGMPSTGVRLIPHPSVTLALMVGASSVTVVDAAGRQRVGSLVAGLGPGFAAIRLRQADDLECLQVRLSPVIAGAVLGVSLADLAGGVVVALDDLWGRAAVRLAERLADTPSWADRFELADQLVARRCADRPPVDPEVGWAWQRIVASRGVTRVDRLATELGWSRKRLWSRFRAQVGLSPKRAATLIRFDHAAHRLAAGQDAARVAADGGYTDQSHLHRDVRAFTGVTPAALPREPFLAIDDVAWPTTDSVRCRRG